MATLIFENSRYQYRALKRDESVLRIPSFRGISSTNYPDNVKIRLKKSDRLDILSFELYGTTRFDWVIADFNGIKLPFSDLKNKETLIAPSRETLYGQILVKLQVELEGTV